MKFEKYQSWNATSFVFPPWFSHVFFVESLFYDFGDWRCLCIPMKGPVEWSVWSVAVSEARSNGVIEQELYHDDERHLENSCNYPPSLKKKWSNIWDFYSKNNTSKYSNDFGVEKQVSIDIFLTRKTHSKHGFILRFQQFRGYNPESQTLPWSNFYRDSKGPPPPKLVFQLWTETTCWRFSSQIRMDCPMIAPKKDRSCTTKTVGTHLRYIDSIDLSLVGKTFYPSPRQKSRSSLIFRCITHQLKFQRFWLHKFTKENLWQNLEPRSSLQHNKKDVPPSIDTKSDYEEVSAFAKEIQSSASPVARPLKGANPYWKTLYPVIPKLKTHRFSPHSSPIIFLNTFCIYFCKLYDYPHVSPTNFHRFRVKVRVCQPEKRPKRPKRLAASRICFQTLIGLSSHKSSQGFLDTVAVVSKSGKDPCIA